MRKLRHEKPAVFLCVLCYIFCIIVLFLLHLGGFIGNVVARNSGEIAMAELKLKDFELVNISQKAKRLTAVTEDPQMILKNKELKVDNIYIEAEYEKPALAQIVFFKNQNEEYSERKMVYSNDKGLFLLAPLGAAGIRLDPTTVVGNEFMLKKIVINAPRPWHTFFMPTANETMLLIILPAISASILWTVHQFKDMLRAKKAVGQL